MRRRYPGQEVNSIMSQMRQKEHASAVDAIYTEHELHFARASTCYASEAMHRLNSSGIGLLSKSEW